MIISESVRDLLYSFNTSLVSLALLLRKERLACRFPVARNNAKKKGTRINQGEMITSITMAPETALIANRDAIVSMSAIIIFFRKNVYVIDTRKNPIAIPKNFVLMD